MTDQSLHDQLTAISTKVRPVDLYERSLQRSAVIGRRRVAGLAGAALAVVVVLAASWQLLGRPVAAPAPAPATHAPSPSSSPTLEPTPVEPTPPPGALDNATLRVPPWPRYGTVGGCGTGPFHLVDGQASLPEQLTLYVGHPIEVTLGGAPAYAVVLTCFGPGEGGTLQVVAYRRTGTAPALIGRVVATNSTEITGFGQLSSPRADEVTVDVLDQFIAGTDVPEFATMHQQRTYRLVGGTFRQVAGDTTFHALPAGVTVQAGTFVFGPPVQGCRIGTMTLHIHNAGTKTASDLAAVVTGLPDLVDCPFAAGQGYASLLARIGTLGPGATKTITVTAVAAELRDPPPTEEAPYFLIWLRTGERQYPDTTQFSVHYQ